MAMAHFHHQHSHDYCGTAALYSVGTLVCSDCTYIQYIRTLRPPRTSEQMIFLLSLRHEYDGDKLRCYGLRRLRLETGTPLPE
jgi:hypothetical protein